ncbi:MAG: acetyl-CoA carboxylase biotin carboxylase subunit [Acidobacteria bacterium]|nr:acetyl-CoA carboxylase biotin carboxylase subunit [Acidobacteriota bacterium]
MRVGDLSFRIRAVESVLIANRGEIAVRVIRAAHDLGLRAIAVYSELDRDAVHVDLADEAWNVGPGPSAESYLNIPKILEVAAASNADAIHPGYGFLAENAGFATAVINAGLIWVGPPPEAIATMGDKIASRAAAEAAGVPTVPGTMEPLTEVDQVAAFAEDHGFPIAIKAAHGGGGKGLKVVRSPDELDAAFESAKREADAWFANPEVYVERYLDNARHIEAQIIFDKHGNGQFLGERDCSMQRRHQKLIEETPAPFFTSKQRSRLGKAALAVARAAAYENAGTVEFLMDETGNLYFLEMNTRIQVEHTITEEATGIDLVAEQLRVAAGEELSFDDVDARGHVMEFRINAEDPARGFLPTPGTLSRYREAAGRGIRVDSGVRQGSSISQYYDTLIAKLIVSGRDRSETIARAKRALAEFDIGGVDTTIPAHLTILDNEDFVAGRISTRLVEDSMDFTHLATKTAPALPEDTELQERNITVEVGGQRYEVRYWSEVIAPTTSGQRPAPRRRAPKLSERSGGQGGEGIVTAPMQGTIVKVHHGAGDAVVAGEPVCILEAMKMENEIKAPNDGEIVDLRVQPGDTVTSGAVLMVIR